MTDGWTRHYGVMNGKSLRTKRLNAHSWEAFVDDESVGNHPTRRQAREFAEKVALGNWQDPDDDGGWDARYEGVHTNRKPTTV